MTSTTASIVNLVASILAAFATVVLAYFAKRQWRTMKDDNEAVRERWEREDKLRAEDLILQGPSGETKTPLCACRISYTPTAKYIVQR